MYIYYIYGAIINSEVKLYNIPELKKEEVVQYDNTDIIYIRLSSIDYTNIPMNGKPIYYSKDLVAFRTELGEFCIQNGNEILVSPYEGEDMNLVTSFIIGYCLSYVFAQRGGVAIHSTALNIGGKGVLLSGVSGAGKSTTAYRLVGRGHKYLADDVAVMFPQRDNLIRPAFPIQKICGKDVENLDAEKLLYINEARDKYSYLNEDKFESNPTPISTLVLLRASDEVEDIQVDEHMGLERFLKVLQCQFLAEHFLYVGTPEEAKYNCLKLAGLTRVFTITRPKKGDTVDAIADAIEAIVK